VYPDGSREEEPHAQAGRFGDGPGQPPAWRTPWQGQKDWRILRDHEVAPSRGLWRQGSPSQLADREKNCDTALWREVAALSPGSRCFSEAGWGHRESGWCTLGASSTTIASAMAFVLLKLVTPCWRHVETWTPETAECVEERAQ